jgi:DNA invertase Pin-like site-specific DNA recombinase
MPRVATYLRVSTDQQSTENQRRDLAVYLAAREWSNTREYCDDAVSGVKERRPALDHLLADARRRRFDTVVIWSLDRLGRSLKHLIVTLEELHQLGIAVISLRDGLDLSTAAGRLQMAVIGAIAQFERDRLRERTSAGLARAKAQGKRLGRRPVELAPNALLATAGLSVRTAAKQLGVSVNTLQKARRLYQQSWSDEAAHQARKEGFFEAVSAARSPSNFTTFAASIAGPVSTRRRTAISTN